MAINPTPFTPKTRNRLVPLVVMMFVAVVLGLTAAVGIWQYLSKTQQKVKELSVTRAVVVAAKQISAGTKLAETDLAIKQLPAQAVPKGYPSSIEQIKGRIVKNTLQTEEIITEGKLVGVGAVGGLPSVIPPGQRAITLMVNDVIGVGGFVNPGDRVDVLAIYKKSANENISNTVLQNLLVLAAGDKIFDATNIQEPQNMVVPNLTLAVSPKEAEVLYLASEASKLQFVLRPRSENNIVSSIGSTFEDLFGYFASSEPGLGNGNAKETPQTPSTAQAQNINLPPKKSIEFILGTRRFFKYL